MISFAGQIPSHRQRVLVAARKVVASAVRFAAVAVLAVAPLPTSALVAQDSGRVTPRGTPATQPTTPQDTRVVEPETEDATRDELTRLMERELAVASDASAKSGDRARAQANVSAVRRRLAMGDFITGDRFLLTLTADSIRRFEIIVRDSGMIELGAFLPISVAGTLRSEVAPKILQHMKRYFRSPEVRVQFLTRLTISGGVGRPGTYSVPPDLLLSDALVAAGGITPSANSDRIEVVRGNTTIVNRDSYRRAVQEGKTIEAVGLRSGDEIRVAQVSRKNWRMTVQVVAISLSVMTAILALIRSSYSS
jgi:polysaccharide biosynthesis/export protein